MTLNRLQNDIKSVKTLCLMLFALISLIACQNEALLKQPIELNINAATKIPVVVQGSLTKKVSVTLDNPKNYANLSLFADDTLLLDSLNIPSKGVQTLNFVIEFPQSGEVELALLPQNANLTIKQIKLEDIKDLTLAKFTDASTRVGLDKVSSIKYGGPTVADIDNDGDYDFIVNNHNQESSKLYWNNGDETVSKHDKNLARWFMHDLHGTSVADYDNDGDLDLIVTQGGGNGKNPSKANFYQNNNGTFVLMTGDVGIFRGGRGRGAKWSDMDLDGDLDLLLFNETSLHGDKPQHFFYENLGNGKFEFKEVQGIQDVHPSRVLLTDLNNDSIDDFIFYSPLSVWLGNGDFTFTEATNMLPKEIVAVGQIKAVADIDIDNDGDLDLYLARSKEVEDKRNESPSFDFNPLKQQVSIKPSGMKGVDEFEFKAEKSIQFFNFGYLARGPQRGKDYPIYLGKDKLKQDIKPGEKLNIQANNAQGWPSDISKNGVYFGYLGNDKWKAALVRNGDIFWHFKFTLEGVTQATPHFEPQNRNGSDYLLRNDSVSQLTVARKPATTSPSIHFTDVSASWNIPKGANSTGVTVGDFNNDSYQDLFVYRWGNIHGRLSDYMLLNTGKGQFETLTQHGANDVDGPGYGDMGQAFDFDGDGDIDLLNGSEGGEWYLYLNENTIKDSLKNSFKNKRKSIKNNFVTVRVGYSPTKNIDPISAVVTIKAKGKTYQKRVGSAGAIFSQSLLNIVHFGLGQAEHIDEIKIRWRNGETVTFNDKAVNQKYDTDALDPKTIKLIPSKLNLREGTDYRLDVAMTPANSNKALQWHSDNNSVVTVDSRGLITAVGKAGESANISVTSSANQLSETMTVTLEPWYPVAAKSIDIKTDNLPLIAGQSIDLRANVEPVLADNKNIIWQSQNSDIASVSKSGTVTANAAGKSRIKAIVQDKPNLTDEVEITVEPYIEPYIKILNEQAFADANLKAGDKLTIQVAYHAGSGNKVIYSDEGGVRVWLRHFKSKWIPVKDIIVVNQKALGTESGEFEAEISLADLKPNKRLPDSHIYQIRASFTASDGKMHDVVIYPLNIVE
ncbi:FG-GAP-like repeat-containing protein [Catenovulum sediminis]|uniref:FG-GAP-like repeat-containing protein n=1 Tax=Catenovulum sediminis TaxID=1740262 RepID=A0ABV1REH5_9ALTE